MTPTVTVTAATWPAVLKSGVALCGAVLHLAGAFPALTLEGLTCPSGNPVTIDAAGAAVASLVIENGAGVVVEGGAFGPAAGSDVKVENAADVALNGLRLISPGTAGITIYRAQHVDVTHPVITGSLGDGVDVGGSSYVTVIGARVTDGAVTQPQGEQPIHPDAVQVWAIQPTRASPCIPSAHVTVTGGYAIGNTQGFDSWNANPACSSSRLTFTNNVLAAPGYNCIGWTNVTWSAEHDNTCLTTPGGPPGWKTRVNISGLTTGDQLGPDTEATGPAP
jgi:hypothetical protein